MDVARSTRRTGYAFAVNGDNEKEGPRTSSPAGRLLEDGTPDPTFGDGGTAKLDFGSHTYPSGIAVDHRGRVVLGGERGRFVGGREVRRDSGRPPERRRDARFLLLRQRDGQHRGTQLEAVLGGIVVDGRNRVVLAGSIIPSGPRPARFPGRFLIAGLTAAGRVDRRIDGDGQVAFRFGPDKKFNAGATSLVLRGSAIYAAGYVRRGPASSIRFAAVGYRP